MPDACAVCGGTRFVRHRTLASRITRVPLGLDRGLYVEAEIDRCTSCGLLRARNTGAAGPESLYSEQSISLDASHAKAIEFKSRAIYSVDELEFLGPSRGRLLDVGCSTGYFLAHARAAGWDVVGTELDVKAAELARSTFGVPVRCGDLRELSFNESEFDAATMWGVLEHLPEPHLYLSHLSRLVKPDGVIVVAVPNAGSLNCHVSSWSRHGWDMFLEPGHLNHFTYETLARLGARAGLDVSRWGTMTCAIRGKLPFMPARSAALEQRVDRWESRSRVFSAVYRGMLGLLDRVHAGDILVIVFRKGAGAS
jgi:2-polyprenyl-3-methyl-5-hydroxy-6-metoxy-1,4-benzoquinol methylase